MLRSSRNQHTHFIDIWPGWAELSNRTSVRALIMRVLMLTAYLLLFNPSAALQADTPNDRPVVYVLTFDGPVTPVLEQYLSDAIDTSVATNAAAVVLQLDTPGGSVDVTKSITQLILASPKPVVVYVSPSGANAGSAGTFVVLSAHVAAMAPEQALALRALSI